MRALSILIKPVSGLCNLNCSYCFYADEMENRSCKSFGRMSRETLEQIFQKIKQSAPLECTIAFQGGEPTLAGLDFFEACICLQKKYLGSQTKVHYAIQTNAYQLDQRWCSFFKENNFLVGVSLDGIKAVHDVYRRDRKGNGTYEQVMKNIALLQEHSVDFNVLTVVNAKTAPRIHRIYESFRKNGFSWQQYIACLDPLQEAEGGQSYSLTPEAYGKFLTELFELWYQDLQKGRQPYIRQFESYIAILLGQQPQACEQRGRCSFQHVIEADGGVYPCDFYVLDEYRAGSVWEEDFAFDKIPESGLHFLKEQQELPQTCRSCPYYALCRNGCRRLREKKENGELRSRYCQAYRYFFDHCLDRMVEIARRI